MPKIFLCVAHEVQFSPVVFTCLHLDLIKVFYLDFGNKESASVSHIRRMQPEFMHLPFQCVECHLPITPMQPEWSQQAR